jgi:hypothetical protein
MQDCITPVPTIFQRLFHKGKMAHHWAPIGVQYQTELLLHFLIPILTGATK